MQSENDANETIWNPIKIFQSSPDYKFALILLNRPILLQHGLVLSMWERAQVTVVVDGGANHWVDYLGELAHDVLNGKTNKYLPTILTGDMDSISPDILNKLKNTKTQVIYTPDQNETDYTKALRQLNEYILKNNKKVDGIHVLVENTGRLDQIISNINTLYKCDKILLNKISVIHIASSSMSWLLKPGVHKINIPKIVLDKKSHCALIPFGDSNSSVTTTGLKWDLNETCMKFGGLISTSNAFTDQPEVSVTTNASIIWSMGIEAFTGVVES